MPVYEITSFRGGLSDYEDKGLPGAFKFGKNLDIRKTVDTLSAGQALTDEGLTGGGTSPSLSASPSSSVSLSSSLSVSASPSATPSPSSSVSRSPSTTPSASVSPSHSISPSPSPSGGLASIFNDLIIAFVKGSDGYTYGVGNTGSIYRRDADAYWQRVYKDPDGEIKGAAEWYSTTKTYLYWATNQTLKRKELPGLGNWNDVETVSTNLRSEEWHTMRVCGGALMIANGPFLAMVGYDESFTNEALNLIPGNLSKTVLERNGRTFIGTFRAGYPTKGINAMIDAEVPMAQIGDNGELFYANMSDSIPIKRFPGGGYVNPYGVTNEIEQANIFEWEQDALTWIDKQAVGNMALFGVYGCDTDKGGIYSYGRKNKNHPMVMNLEYSLDVDEIGAIEHVEGTTLISYRDGSTYGVKSVDAGEKAEAVYEGLDLKAPMKKPANITPWTIAELYMDPLPDGSWVEFWYKVNKTGDFIRAYTVDGDPRFTTATGKKAVFRMGVQGEVFEPRVVLHPTGNSSPSINRIRVYFQ